MKQAALTKTWLLENWVLLIEKGMSPSELTAIYWREFESKSFKQTGAGLKGGREQGRRIYARARRKLAKLRKEIT